MLYARGEAGHVWEITEKSVNMTPEATPTDYLSPYVIEATEEGTLAPVGPLQEVEPLTAQGPLVDLPPIPAPTASPGPVEEPSPAQPPEQLPVEPVPLPTPLPPLDDVPTDPVEVPPEPEPTPPLTAAVDEDQAAAGSAPHPPRRAS